MGAAMTADDARKLAAALLEAAGRSRSDGQLRHQVARNHQHRPVILLGWRAAFLPKNVRLVHP